MDGKVRVQKLNSQVGNTVEQGEEHWLPYAGMMLQDAVNIVAGVGADENGRHRHDHHQNDRGFEKLPHRC